MRAAGNPLTANQYCAMAASVSGPYCSVMSDRHMIYQPVVRAEALARACADGALPLESTQRIAQMHLEPVLLERAKADPHIDVRFSSRLMEFSEDSNGVTGTIQPADGGQAVRVNAKLIAGCDGPNSRVRNGLGLDYDNTKDLLGELFIAHFRSDEVSNLYPNRETYWHTWIARPGFSGLLVSPDASRNEYVLHRPFAPREGETVESVIDAALGAKLKYEVIQSGPWRPQFLVANGFSKQRRLSRNAFFADDSSTKSTGSRDRWPSSQSWSNSSTRTMFRSCRSPNRSTRRRAWDG